MTRARPTNLSDNVPTSFASAVCRFVGCPAAGVPAADEPRACWAEAGIAVKAAAMISAQVNERSFQGFIMIGSPLNGARYGRALASVSTSARRGLDFMTP